MTRVRPPGLTCASCRGDLCPHLARRTDEGWRHAKTARYVGLAERSRRAAAEANAARREDVEWMTRTGEALDGAAARLGITPGALETWLRRQGMHDTLRTLLARNPAGEASRRPAA